jgi:membrane fusion protein (multidrug efflux system)
VNGYVTFVAPRVSGQVTRVSVEDNNRVKKGDVLVELDPKPYQVEVAIKQAAVDTAQANLLLAQANVRGLIGQARSNRFKLPAPSRTSTIRSRCSERGLPPGSKKRQL